MRVGMLHLAWTRPPQRRSPAPAVRKYAPHPYSVQLADRRSPPCPLPLVISRTVELVQRPPLRLSDGTSSLRRRQHVMRLARGRGWQSCLPWLYAAGIIAFYAVLDRRTRVSPDDAAVSASAPSQRQAEPDLPPVTIVVPARNE